MFMKKVFVLFCFSISLLYSFDLGSIGENNLKVSKTSSLPKDNKDVKRYVENLEKNGVSHPSQNILLGITYDFGIKEANIKKDEKKAIMFYKRAIKAGIVYGSIRLSIIEAKNGKMEDAINTIDQAYFSQKQTINEDKILLNFAIQLNLEKKDFLKTYYYLKEDVRKYQNPDSQMKLFFLKYYGRGEVEQDIKEADYYLKEACLNPKATKDILFFCKNSKLVR